MKTFRHLLSNTFLAFLSSLIVKASNTILFIGIGRLMGPTEAGVYNLAITFFTVALALSAFGLHELLVRELASRPREGQKYLAHYLLMRLFMATAAYLLLLVLLQFNLPYTDHTQAVIRVLVLAIFPEAIFTIIQAVFTAYEQLPAPSLSALLNSLLKLGPGLWILTHQGSALEVAWVMVAAGWISLLVLIPAVLRLFRHIEQIPWQFSSEFIGSQLQFAPGFIAIGIFTTLDFQLDAFLISLFLSETELGWYGAAQTIMLGFWMMPMALRTAVYPIITRYYQGEEPRLISLYRRINRYTLLLAFPMCTGVALIARPIIRLIFGPAFDSAVPALQGMIWAVIFSFLMVPNARLMLVANHQRQAGWITGFSMAANALLNLWLIPRYGILGAAISRTLASFLFFLMLYGYVQKYLLHDSVGPLFLRPFLATVVMVIFVWLLPPVLPLSILVGGVVYITAILLLKAIPPEDWLFFRQFLKPLKI